LKDEEVKVYYDRVLRKRRKKSVLNEGFEEKVALIKKMKGIN